jgi:hypothetical protein
VESLKHELDEILAEGKRKFGAYQRRLATRRS